MNNSNLTNMDVDRRLQEFMENEAKSCSMDFGCVTPLYVYRMWGGSVSIIEIDARGQVSQWHLLKMTR